MPAVKLTAKQRRMSMIIAQQREVAVRKRTTQMQGGFASYHDVHKQYIWLCDKQGVSPDADLLHNLGCVFNPAGVIACPPPDLRPH
jgi:hypothetical protein